MFTKKVIFILTIAFAINNLFASTYSEAISNLRQQSTKNSPDLKLLEAKKNKSNYAIYSNWSNHTPNLYLNLKNQKNFFPSSSLVQSLGLSTPKYVWSIDYQWSLINYNSLLNTKKVLSQSDLNQIEYENGQKEFEVNFNTALLNYLLAQYKQATIINSIKKAETAKKEATIGFEIGQKTKIDVLRAEANFVSLNSKKTTYKDEAQNSKSKLILITGLDEKELIFLDNLSEEEYLNMINDNSVYRKIDDHYDLKNSPILFKLSEEIKINNLTAEAITSKEWPELKIQGSFENTQNQINSVIHHPNRSHSIALILTIPIFSGGSLISSNFEQYYAKKQLAYSNTKSLNELDNNFKNQFIKTHALETLVESLNINVKQFEELYRLTSKSYSLGKSTLFELLDVQDNLLESKINLATSKIQLYQLAESYNWQTGQK